MKRMTIDLHGMSEAQAKSVLMKAVKSCSDDVEELEVVHGFHGGQALLGMVRSFTHPKVARRIVGLNNGSTILIMKR